MIKYLPVYFLCPMACSPCSLLYLAGLGWWGFWWKLRQSSNWTILPTFHLPWLVHPDHCTVGPLFPWSFFVWYLRNPFWSSLMSLASYAREKTRNKFWPRPESLGVGQGTLPRGKDLCRREFWFHPAVLNVSPGNTVWWCDGKSATPQATPCPRKCTEKNNAGFSGALRFWYWRLSSMFPSV